MPLAALLPGFREQLLRMLADRSPAGLAHRLTVANRAGPFGPNGFPKPSGRPGPGRGTASCTTRVPWWRARPRRSWRRGPSRWGHRRAAPRPAVGGAGGSTHGPSVSTTSPPRRAAARPAAAGTGNGTPGASTPGGTTAPVAFRSPGAPGSAVCHHEPDRRPRAPRPPRRHQADGVLARPALAPCRSRLARSTWCRSTAPRPGVHAHRPGRSGQRLLGHGRVHAGQATSASHPPRGRWPPARA